MFALVADVELYPEFVPHWSSVRVFRRRPNGYSTEQSVRFGPFSHRFTTETLLFPLERIEVRSTSFPFERLSLTWSFEPAREGGCRISLTACFSLRLRGLRVIGSLLSKESIDRMIAAFEARAAALYGLPSSELRCKPAS